MLDYSFLFEPGKAWANLYQFENELIQFFAERGMDCLQINMAQGQGGRRALLLTPKEQVSVPEKQTKPVEVKKQVENVQKDQQRVIREKDGKYAS